MSVLQRSPQQLLVNKAACWGCSLWVAATVFSIFGFGVGGLFFQTLILLSSHLFSSHSPGPPCALMDEATFQFFISLKLASDRLALASSGSVLAKCEKLSLQKDQKALLFFKKKKIHLSQFLNQTICALPSTSSCVLASLSCKSDISGAWMRTRCWIIYSHSIICSVTITPQLTVNTLVWGYSIRKR